MIKVRLHKIGDNENLNIIGSVKVLQLIPNTPIVFLIDEIHDNLEMIQINVTNAIELINNANVRIIGVESHLGGQEWDPERKIYYEDEYDNSFKIVGSANFANALIPEYNSYMYGVEGNEIFNKVFVDLSKGLFNDVTEHPLNEMRSKHFVKTIIDRWKINPSCNIILNCGMDHNTHIEEWINSGSIDNFVGFKASFIRLNAF